jgi:hypothetical protein
MCELEYSLTLSGDHRAAFSIVPPECGRLSRSQAG